VWISGANARQRAGRAGRCRPGLCFHLYSKTRASALAPFALPELLRSPLDNLALQVKLVQEAAMEAEAGEAGGSNGGKGGGKGGGRGGGKGGGGGGSTSLPSIFHGTIGEFT
jgi:hypothetical protein